MVLENGSGEVRTDRYSRDFGAGSGRAGVESPLTQWAYLAR